MIEVRIGVAEAPKELIVETDESTETVQEKLNAALGAGVQTMLWLTDKKGKQIGLPTSKIAYVEIEEKTLDRQVGFG